MGALGLSLPRHRYVHGKLTHTYTEPLFDFSCVVGVFMTTTVDPVPGTAPSVSTRALWLGLPALLASIVLLLVLRWAWQCRCCFFCRICKAHCSSSDCRSDHEVEVDEERSMATAWNADAQLVERQHGGQAMAPSNIADHHHSISSSSHGVGLAPMAAAYTDQTHVHLSGWVHDPSPTESRPLLQRSLAATYGAMREWRDCPPHPYYNVSTAAVLNAAAAWSGDCVLSPMVASLTSKGVIGPPLMFVDTADESKEEFRGGVAARAAAAVGGVGEDAVCEKRERAGVEAMVARRTATTASTPTAEGLSSTPPRSRLQPLSPNIASRGHRTACARDLLPPCATELWRVPESCTAATTPLRPARTPLRLPFQEARDGCSVATMCASTCLPLTTVRSGRSTPTPVNCTDRIDPTAYAGSGGEDITTLRETLLVELRMRRAELAAAEVELDAVQTATAHADAERVRLTSEASDMERYKGVLDGIIAFTLRELEDEAIGVEEAEAEMQRASELALHRLAAAQERLRQTSLRQKGRS